MGDRHSGIARLERRLRADPGNTDTRIALAETLAAEGDWTRALAMLDAGAEGAASRDLLLRAADIAHAAGQPADARRRYEAVLRERPDDGHAFAGLARVAFAEGDEERAWAILRDGFAASRRHASVAIAWSALRSTKLRPALAATRRTDGPPIGRAALVAMVKDEADVIGAFLDHHYRLGLRNFVLLDNGSTDGTRDEVGRFRAVRADARVAVIDDGVVGYYQGAKTTAAARFAAAYFAPESGPVDWIFPLDADEFLTFPDAAPSLAEILDALDRDGRRLLRAYLCDAASLDPAAALLPGGDPFATFPVVTPPMARVIGKVAFRYAPEAVLHMGNHHVDGVVRSLDELGEAAAWGGYLTHFAFRGLEHARRKIVNGGRAYLAAKGMEKAGRRWRRRYARFEARGDSHIAAVYERYVDGVASAAGLSGPVLSEEDGAPII